MQQTAPVSTPSAPPPPPVDPVSPAAPAPVVPYGPGSSDPSAESAPLSTSVTAEGVAKGFGRTALKWGIRILLPLLIRAIVRALSRR